MESPTPSSIAQENPAARFADQVSQRLMGLEGLDPYNPSPTFPISGPLLEPRRVLRLARRLVALADARPRRALNPNEDSGVPLEFVISKEVALQEYWLSEPTIYRSFQDGRLSDLRGDRTGKGVPLRFDRRELDQHFTRKSKK